MVLKPTIISKSKSPSFRRMGTFNEIENPLNIIIEPSSTNIETTSDKTTDRTTDRTTDKTTDRTTDKTTDKTSDKTTDKTSDKTSDKISDNTSELSVLNPNHTIKYKEIVNILKDNYSFDENKNSTALDILALYLKGQKIIYMESKTYCEKRLNSLMLPAILLAAVCSILNFILKDYAYGTIIISSFNACNSFILSIINYLKLAEKSQNHLMAAQRFHNLESCLEIKSGRSLFFHNSIEIEKSLEQMEKEIKEIQSSNQFIIPEAIRYRYPKIFSSNIFSLVKEIKNEEILYINKLKSTVQQIHEHTHRRDELLKAKSVLNTDIINYRGSLHQLELEAEICDTHIEEDKKDKKEKNEQEIILYNSLHDVHEKNEMKYSEIEPPELQLPDSGLSSQELYEKIQAWKLKYDMFVSKNREKEDTNQYHAAMVRKEEDIRREIVKIEEDKMKMIKHQEMIRKSIELKTNIKHLKICQEEAKANLLDIESSIREETELINTYDQEKDDAFENIVKHRQRYIQLSDDMNREINQHIHKKKKCCQYNPCDFFNT